MACCQQAVIYNLFSKVNKDQSEEQGQENADQQSAPKKGFDWKQLLEDVSKGFEEQSQEQEKQVIVATASEPVVEPRPVARQVKAKESYQNIVKPERKLDQRVLTSRSESASTFQVDYSDLQYAVVMAEILGPPRAYKKRIR